MKLNRKWLMVIALVMSLTMATAGTLAYLTDRDTEVNTFTMGNVDIELNEDFEQGAELIPGLDIEKEPTITNVGKNDAWVWATIAIPAALDNEDASKNVLHFNMSKASVAEGQWTWWEEGSTSEWLKETDVEYEGIKYNVYTVLYQTALKPGETTENPVIYKVYMDPHVDITPEGDLYHVENGEAVELGLNIKEDGNPKIYVSAYAMQTDKFDTVYAAYAAYTAQWDKDTTKVDADDYEWGTPAKLVTVSDMAGLKAALKEASDNDTPVVVDAQNEDLGDLDDVTFPDGSVIKNATFTGDEDHGSYGNNAFGTVTFVDCTFDSGYAYAAHFDGGKNANLIFKDCDFEGWNSFGNYQDAVVSLTFEGCTFGKNGYYGLVRAYQNATFTNCTFEADFEGADVHQDAYANTVVEFNNCTGISADNIYFNEGKYEGTTTVGTARDTGAKVFIDGTDVTAQIKTW